MSTATDNDIKELKEELNSLKSDISALGKTLSKFARDSANDGRETLRNAAERSKKQVQEGLHTVEKQVEERPITSLAIALGVGFILGRLLDR